MAEEVMLELERISGSDVGVEISGVVCALRWVENGGRSHTWCWRSGPDTPPGWAGSKLSSARCFSFPEASLNRSWCGCFAHTLQVSDQQADIQKEEMSDGSCTLTQGSKQCFNAKCREPSPKSQRKLRI